MAAPQAAPTSAFSSTLKSEHGRRLLRADDAVLGAVALRQLEELLPTELQRPSSAWSSPEITLSAVDFPEPLGPISACTDPGDSSSSSRSSASRLPNRFERPRTAEGAVRPAQLARRARARPGAGSHPPPPGAGQWNQPRAAESEDDEHPVARQHLLQPAGGSPRSEPISSATFENAAITARPTTGPSGTGPAEDDRHEELEREHRAVGGRVGDPATARRRAPGQARDHGGGRERSEPQARDRDADAERGLDRRGRRRARARGPGEMTPSASSARRPA